MRSILTLSLGNAASAECRRWSQLKHSNNDSNNPTFPKNFKLIKFKTPAVLTRLSSAVSLTSLKSPSTFLGTKNVLEFVFVLQKMWYFLQLEVNYVLPSVFYTVPPAGGSIWLGWPRAGNQLFLSCKPQVICFIEWNLFSLFLFLHKSLIPYILHHACQTFSSFYRLQRLLPAASVRLKWWNSASK